MADKADLLRSSLFDINTPIIARGNAMPLGNRIMILAWSLVMITLGLGGIAAQNSPTVDRSWVPVHCIVAGVGFLLLGVFGYRARDPARLAKEPVPDDWPSEEVRSRMVIQRTRWSDRTPRSGDDRSCRAADLRGERSLCEQVVSMGSKILSVLTR
jgi:hypothetical protein